MTDDPQAGSDGQDDAKPIVPGTDLDADDRTEVAEEDRDTVWDEAVTSDHDPDAE